MRLRSAFSAEASLMPRKPAYTPRPDALADPSFRRLLAISGHSRCSGFRRDIVNHEVIEDSVDAVLFDLNHLPRRELAPI